MNDGLEPVFIAAVAVLEMAPERGSIIVMTPVGRVFDHDIAVGLAKEERIVILSGHHAEVAKWRRRQNLLITATRRPELLAGAEVSKDERAWLREQGIEV